jgi:hypothetical protein
MKIDAKLWVALLWLAASLPAWSESAGQKLVRAYPQFLSGYEGGDLIWHDGTWMKLSDGRKGKTPEQTMDSPDVDDMFAAPYPKGRLVAPPATDPGRVRYAPLFDKMYGDCTKGEVEKNLVTVPWLPDHGGGALRITRVNGVDKAVAAVSAELSRLPAETIKAFILPTAGTYSCRAVAGTDRRSAHGWGIAIDIATRSSDYWRWSPGGAYRNRIPNEVVEVFERHGFIWGGKWKAFDTMHFEYRPELLLD